MNTEQDLIYRLWSVLVFGAGSSKLSELYERFNEPARLYMALGQDGAERAMLTSQRLAAVDGITLQKAETVIEDCAKRNIRIVSISDSDYPETLKTIYAPPQILFYIGSLKGINTRHTLGVVGTRTPSEYSRQVTSALVSSLAKNDIDIVSGFADGIDICAHLTAARCGTRTYAVLGCGVDHIYPKSNERYRETVSSHGAVISEFLPGTIPNPKNFPQRNRILSGLSDAVAVIEAGTKSGSLNTASHAAVQGRTVFTVPPSDLFDRRYAGNISLLRDGSTPLMGTRDILDEFGITDTDSTKAEQKKPVATEPEKVSEKSIPATVKEAADTGSEEGNRLIHLIEESGPLPLSALAELSGDDTEHILELVSELELGGYIENTGGEYRLT